MPKAMSAATLRTIQKIQSGTASAVVAKIGEHLISSSEDVDNAMNLFIADCAFYKPFMEKDICEIMVALAKDIDKFKLQRPNR